MATPRFGDTFKPSAALVAAGSASASVSNSIRQSNFPPHVAPVFAPSGHSFAPNSNMSLHQEQVKHFTYWNYVAIKRIADRFSEPFPHVGFPVRRSGGAQHQMMIRGKQRQFMSQSYGSRWLQSHEHDLEPVADNHPMIELLHHVNGEDTWPEFAYETAVMWLLTGKFYWWVIPNSIATANSPQGMPAELWVIPTQWVEPIYHPQTGELLRYDVTPDGNRARRWEIPPEQIVSGKFKSPKSKVDGWSALLAGAMWIDNVESIESSKWHSFKNGPNPSMLLEFDGEKYNDPSGDIVERIKEKFLARAAGVTRAGEPLLIPPGVTSKAWTRPPKEMDYQDSGAQVRDNNLALHGVPPVVAGITSDYTRATAEAANYVFCEVTLNPLFRQFAGILTEKIGPRFDDRIRCWYEDCRPANAEQTLKEMEFAFGSGARTPDEIRQWLGDEPFGSDPYTTGYVPSGFRPLNEDDLELEEEQDDARVDDDE
jgi:phage portal protein BeeE